MFFVVLQHMSTAAAHTQLVEWVNLYGDDLYRIAYYKTSNKEVAEDLVQETFLAASSSIKKFKGDAKPKTWLVSILNHKVMDYHRKSFKSPDMVNSLNTPEIIDFFDGNGMWTAEGNPSNWDDVETHLLDDVKFIEVFNDCMDELPKTWFSAIQLKYLTEKKGKEICKELGITPTNFWQMLRRAKLQLKFCLEKKWFKAK